MSRGKQLKTLVREAYRDQVIKSAAEKALIEVNMMADLKFKEKHAADIAKVKMMDKLADPDYILKLTSILAVTIIIHNGVDWVSKTVNNADRWVWIASPFLGLFKEAFGWKPPQEEESTADQLTTWLISIGLAVLIVENFGDIMRGLGGMATGILALAEMLLL